MFLERTESGAAGILVSSRVAAVFAGDDGMLRDDWSAAIREPYEESVSE
jgi:hypothetical protein